jgi:hypothetical protein
MSDQLKAQRGVDLAYFVAAYAGAKAIGDPGDAADEQPSVAAIELAPGASFVAE